MSRPGGAASPRRPGPGSRQPRQPEPCGRWRRRPRACGPATRSSAAPALRRRARAPAGGPARPAGRLRRPGSRAARPPRRPGTRRRRLWSRGPSCCGSTRRRRPTAGGSCPAASAAISERPDVRAICRCGAGIKSADVWILSDGPSSAVTLMPAGRRPGPPHRRAPAQSRAADNLFWLGRYLERAEATIRLVVAPLRQRRLGCDRRHGRVTPRRRRRCASARSSTNGAPSRRRTCPRRPCAQQALHEPDAYGSALRPVRSARRQRRQPCASASRASVRALLPTSRTLLSSTGARLCPRPQLLGLAERALRPSRPCRAWRRRT